MGGFLATIVEFLRSVVDGAQAPEAKVDRGGGDALTAYHFAPPGDDSQPLPGDVAFLGRDEGAGNAQLLGYQDPRNAGVAGPGEKRIYARSSDGTPVCEVWLKTDGSVVVSNDAVSVELGADGAALIENEQGSVELGADGAIALTNAQGSVDIDASGNVTATTPLGTFGAGTHMHTSPFGPTGPPIPGT
jgi:hypothetical protein